MKTAIVLGATGLTGSFVLEKLLKDERYSVVKVFTRRSLEISHEKIEEHVLDLFELDGIADGFHADEVYCCIGTTKAKTPNLDVYRKVDYGIPFTAARLSKQNNISTFLVVSAMGANAESGIFYNRIKGEMERDVSQVGLPQTFFFQPSLISGQRKEKRTFEFLGKQLMKVANHLLVGPLKKYQSIHPATIAEAMIKVANTGYRKNRIESDEIKEIANATEH